MASSTKRFTVQTGQNNSIKVFNAETGELYRTVSLGGEILSQPVVSESTFSVMVNSSGSKVMRIYNLPSCTLKTSVPSR